MRAALFVGAKIADRLAHLGQIMFQRGFASGAFVRVMACEENQRQRQPASHQCRPIAPMFFSDTEMP